MVVNVAVPLDHTVSLYGSKHRQVDNVETPALESNFLEKADAKGILLRTNYSLMAKAYLTNPLRGRSY